MNHSEVSLVRLDAQACGDDATLRDFVKQTISVNAWPIHSRPLRQQIRRHGLDLAEARSFDPALEHLQTLMHRMVAASRRVERTLSIDNAFHTTVHNYEVLLRLLLLEWPLDQPVPKAAARAVDQAYDSFSALEPILSDLMRRMLEVGVDSWRLARDVLAAAGHDYGHSGDTDRRDATGTLLPLTHEETAERHVAKFGIEHGFPPALILESLAGIRATTLHIRQDRDKVQATNDFERKMTLADVAGCVMRPDLWMTHVAIPVLHERMGDGVPIHTVSEAFDNELRFLSFVRANRLAPVPSGSRLWGAKIDRRIALIERLLERKDLLEPLDAHGFSLVEQLTHKLANADDLESTLEEDGVDPKLRELFTEFLPAVSMSA